MKLLTLLGIALLIIPLANALVTCLDTSSPDFCLPTNKIDGCSKVANYDNDVCLTGCCITDNGMTHTVKGLCNGTFDKECRTECCCTNYGYKMVPRKLCDGKYAATSSETVCKTICSKYEFINGCSPKKPDYCIDGYCYEDCTGGDHIVGNGNDCGCPGNQKCTSSGKCITIKKKTKQPQKCSSTSHNEKGLCLCNDNLYDDYCHENLNIDFDNDGCINFNPCEKKSFFNPLMIFGILFIIILIVIHHFRKNEDRYN